MADLLLGQLDLEGGRCVGQVMGLGGADDRGGDHGLAQHPGHRDLGHLNATFLGYLLDRLDDGLVDVEVERSCDLVGVARAECVGPRGGRAGLCPAGE